MDFLQNAPVSGARDRVMSIETPKRSVAEISRSNPARLTVLVIAGILFCYVMQMAPSPILTVLQEEFSLAGNDALLNLSASIIFPFIVLACLTGPALERKLGTYHLYTAALVLAAAGAFLNFLAGGSYPLLLAGRAVYGLGFGFAVPFIGSAIMKWFAPSQHGTMDTVNSFFPFVGTLMAFLLIAPICHFFGDRWEWGLGIWGFPIAAVLLLWLLTVREKKLVDYSAGEEAPKAEKGMFRDLLRRREIRLICVTFICDFICYSYIAVILPTLLAEAGHMGDSAANLCAAVAFPAVGALGAFGGGLLTNRTGRRKPSLVMGQVGKLIGISIAALGAEQSVVLLLAGTVIFGFANGFWMPAMYCTPMDLPGMSPAKVGSAFSLINAVGLTFGFIAPTVGGLLTDLLVKSSGLTDAVASHVFGLRWSLFLFGLVNIIGIICMVRMRETGRQQP